ncbi:hypothetical protein [Peribacillus acanthi]|nr:hypothetical protein [Peribacillus acanthi]
MGRYLIGIVMVIVGFILLIITKNNNFKEVEESLVIANHFYYLD